MVKIYLVDLEEARGALTAAIESQIKLLQDPAPTSGNDHTEEGFWNGASNIWGVVQSPRVLLAYLKTREISVEGS